MAPSPVAVLAIIAIYVAFYAVYTATEAETYGLDDAPTVDQPDGLLETIGGVLGTVWTVVTYIFGALTFNVEGAPDYIRLPVAVIIIASLIWSVATLVRGN